MDLDVEPRKSHNFVILYNFVARQSTPSGVIDTRYLEQNGSLNPGERHTEISRGTATVAKTDSQITLTDVKGYEHRHSLPSGRMREEIWSKQKAVAEINAASLFSLELLPKIRLPSVTVISDTTASKACFSWVTGSSSSEDALTLFRPHDVLEQRPRGF